MKWISVKDELPEHMQDVLVYMPQPDICGRHIRLTFINALDPTCRVWHEPCYDPLSDESPVTHWMQLPDPPSK